LVQKASGKRTCYTFTGNRKIITVTILTKRFSNTSYIILSRKVRDGIADPVLFFNTSGLLSERKKVMIPITPTLSIDESELQLDFIRSSGPGGQNVNKVATGVQLRFPIDTSPSLPDEIKARLHTIARNRITEEGVLIIEAKRYRTQDQNRSDAVARLVALITQAAEKPKTRRKTRPTAASQARRIETKKRRGSIKKTRRMPAGDLD
jgi:ribosome-associated protein